jgi:hypothetical protein
VVLKLPTGGNRYEMVQRVQDYLDAAHSAQMVAGASSGADLKKQVLCHSGRRL